MNTFRCKPDSVPLRALIIYLALISRLGSICLPLVQQAPDGSPSPMEHDIHDISAREVYQAT
ncbi:MAG: hypothetical protein ACPF8Z_06390, partial [Schleiferiaceae bacterium]